MIKYIIFMALMAGAAWEYFYYGQFGIAIVGGIYSGLLMQAESAAHRFVKYGLYPQNPALAFAAGSWKTEKPNRDIGAILSLQPLGEAREKKRSSPDPERIRPAAAKPAAPPQPAPPPAARPEKKIQSPRFGGKPHEVLGINENAATKTIVGAYRHWVKQYHPDHAHSAAQLKNAGEQTRCLTTAKAALLERRKLRKAA